MAKLSPTKAGSVMASARIALSVRVQISMNEFEMFEQHIEERYDPDLWTDELAFLNQPGQADIGPPRLPIRAQAFVVCLGVGQGGETEGGSERPRTAAEMRAGPSV